MQTNPEQCFLLVKRGLYYAPNNQGYTGVKDRAGRYREVDALGLDGVTAIHEDKAPLFAPACWQETKAAFYEEKIAAFAEREARLVGALELVGRILPSAAGLDDAPNSKAIPLYINMGELRAIKATLAALKDRTHG